MPFLSQSCRCELAVCRGACSVWLVITTVLGSLVLPGLMTLVIGDKAKPYLISSSTPAAPFIEKSLSISQGYSICHLAGDRLVFAEYIDKSRFSKAGRVGLINTDLAEEAAVVLTSSSVEDYSHLVL